MLKPQSNINVVKEIADVQGSPDSRNITIDKVGIKDVKHPLLIKDKMPTPQHTVAMCNMYVELPHNFKGTHMSRFIDILGQHNSEISVNTFESILIDTHDRLETGTAFVELTFPFFVEKEAPVSGVKSYLDYEVTFIGEMRGSSIINEMQVVVPVTSLCPCSKEISKYGAHNQRSNVTVRVRSNPKLWIKDIIDVVEKEASCELWGLLKRPDEKYVTERAYENPKFVEDIVRDVASCLNEDDRIEEYVVEAENFESIHNHSAYAKIVSRENNG